MFSQNTSNALNLILSGHYLPFSILLLSLFPCVFLFPFPFPFLLPCLSLSCPSPRFCPLSFPLRPCSCPSMFPFPFLLSFLTLSFSFLFILFCSVVAPPFNSTFLSFFPVLSFPVFPLLLSSHSHHCLFLFPLSFPFLFSSFLSRSLALDFLFCFSFLPGSFFLFFLLPFPLYSVPLFLPVFHCVLSSPLPVLSCAFGFGLACKRRHEIDTHWIVISLGFFDLGTIPVLWFVHLCEISRRLTVQFQNRCAFATKIAVLIVSKTLSIPDKASCSLIHSLSLFPSSVKKKKPEAEFHDLSNQFRPARLWHRSCRIRHRVIGWDTSEQSDEWIRISRRAVHHAHARHREISVA